MLKDDQLPPEPTEAEWAEAQRRKSPFALEVEGEYEVRDGLLQVTERGRDRTVRQYFPMACRGVVGEFSLLPIGDESALCSFASRWGLLGFDRLARAILRVRSMYDPRAWVWAHLAGIQTVIRLHRLWRKQDSDGASQFLLEPSIPGAGRFAFLQVNTLIEHRELVEAQDKFIDALAPAVAVATRASGQARASSTAIADALASRCTLARGLMKILWRQPGASWAP